MERLQTLFDNFREQLQAGASPERLLLTLQMMQSELLHLQQVEKNMSSASAHVDIPAPVPVPQVQPRVVEVLDVDEKALEAELEEIRINAQARAKMAVQSRPPLLNEERPEVPQNVLTPLEKTAEVNELLSAGAETSLNDRFVNSSTEVAQAIAEPDIKDLRKGIGVNDRFVFINELFRGDDSLYEKSIKTINSFKIYAEAEFWIRQELKAKLGWIQDNPLVRQFDQLIRRRFSAT